MPLNRDLEPVLASRDRRRAAAKRRLIRAIDRALRRWALRDAIELGQIDLGGEGGV